MLSDAATTVFAANAVVQQSLAAVGGIASPGIFSPKSALKRTRRSVDAAGASPASLVKSMRKAMKASPVRGIFGLSGAPVIPSINFGDVTINLNTFGLPEVRGCRNVGAGSESLDAIHYHSCHLGHHS